jgi:hypothetical protein
MLSVIMFNVLMVSVMAPFFCPRASGSGGTQTLDLSLMR